MKKTLLLLSFIALLNTTKAQETKPPANKFIFAGGIVSGLPIGDFGDTHSFAIGAELQPEYRLTALIALYGSAGYTEFFGKKFDFEEAESLNTGLLPVLIGAKVYISPQVFLGAKAGVGFLTGWGSGTAFDYQPQFGFNNKNFMINFSYNGISRNSATLSSLLLSVLYKF